MKEALVKIRDLAKVSNESDGQIPLSEVEVYDLANNALLNSWGPTIYLVALTKILDIAKASLAEQGSFPESDILDIAETALSK